LSIREERYRAPPGRRLGKIAILQRMAMRVEKLASGPGWSVSDIDCSSGPHDRPFEEQHPGFCIAAVMRGTFQYRTSQGATTLAPGAVLLGNHQSGFECGHDHSTGDRCLSFMFDPDYFDTVLSSISDGRTATFRAPGLPPLMTMSRIFADAELARFENDPTWFEQIALDLAAKAVTLVADGVRSQKPPTYRDQQRIAAALHYVEASARMPLSINELASGAAMSPYHFLRTFRRVVGTTPHQFILRTRLQDAALQLRRSALPVIDIALDAGFRDLSTFNRRFRAFMAMTPSAYRATRSGGRIKS